MAYIRTCVQNLGEIRRPVRNNCPSSLIIDNNDVTYYVITCNSAFEYNNDVTYYVITRNYQWTPETLTRSWLYKQVVSIPV